MAGHGRPPLPRGTWGDIWVSDNGAPYKARARYRDRDGVTRTVARFGQTKGEAKQRLRDALGERQLDGGVGLRRSMPVRQAATLWLAELDASRRATNTKDTYERAVNGYVIPTLGGVRLEEATTSVVDSALATVRDKHGPSAAKTTRAVLRGIFGMAVRHDALSVNPVRETQSIPTPRKLARSLLPEQVDLVTDALRTDKRAMLLDLPDLVEFGLATGCRIGEVLAIRETVLDLDAGTVEINATAIRVKGRGMVIQERPKTAAGHRVLALPPFAVAMLKRRREEVRLNPPAVTVLAEDGKTFRQEPVWVAFPAPLARSVRDPSNTAGDLREALNRIGRTDEPEPDWVPPFEWVSYHTFRKTVADRMDEAGCSEREIADQLGHARPSMTQDNYMGRKVVTAKAAAILDR